MKRRMRIFDDSDRVARVLEIENAYMLVVERSVVWKSRSHSFASTVVEFVLATLDAEGVWDFEDRVDPDDSDARLEIDAQEICWYGKKLHVRWLEAQEAKQVMASVFYQFGA